MKRHYRFGSDDFRILFSRGRRMDASFFRVVARKNAVGHPRFALVAPRAVDKRAVVRNRIRRRAREWLYKALPRLRRPLDLAIIFKKEAVLMPRKKFYAELEEKIFRVFNE